MRAGVGIPQLERVLGPVPEHATLLFVNDPGVEGEPFLYQAAHHRLHEGGKVIYAVTNRSPDAVLVAMASFGFDVLEHKDKLHFLDSYSALMGSRSSARYHVGNPADPADFARTLDRASREHPDALLVVDSLSSVVDQSTPERFAAAFPTIHESMRRFAMAETLFTRWGYSHDIDDLLARFDGVVSLKGVEDRVMLSQYFRVERAGWAPQADHKPRLYKSLKPGGVHVYIPKIVVTGPYNAGKSSFVHAVSDVAVSADRLGTTVALDHGRFTVDGLTADVFGTPGQARFDPVLKIVAGQALGVIVVVDSTKPESFDRANEMLQQTWRQGLPGIIAANKQDLPDALSPEEVARRLAPPPGVKVVGCTGQDAPSAREVVRQLVEQILAQGAPA